MTAPAQKPATYEDLFDLPDHVVGEIIRGVLHTHPRPAAPHAHAASSLGMDIGPAFQRGRGGPGGWWILFEPELHLGADILVPDIAGWRRERMPEVPDVAYFDLPPDWVCEVLSPSTAKLDRGEKLAIYATHGVCHAWLIDPKARTLEVFSLSEGKWLLQAVHTDDAVIRAEPFDAIELELDALWI